MKIFHINEVDRVEILTLADNYIDAVVGDDSAVIKRANTMRDFGVRDSILAEHGFSAFVTATNKGKTTAMVFDFGLGRDTAARNADTLQVDLTKTEAAALSHGHLDHFGGLEEVAKKIRPEGMQFVVHPAAFRKSRIVYSTATSCSWAEYRRRRNLKKVCPMLPTRKTGSRSRTIW
jgi:7,8-dihydropterin-6-yl-methyl-4-(beta-D-ribofuranosyl)aminobenzene 5'-phosphate synthase